MADKSQYKVTLVRSLHGQLANIAASARGLGLRKIHQTVTVVGTPENLGMINTATHLLKVEKSA
ncbi:MAG: rpmD [Gammaproteobacteria bacterium]|jgi:large subunit ribosomal protein L30|nr:rpmD [Gammaproteobacteria bacterium]